MRLHKTKKLLRSKRNYQERKRQQNEWEKVFANDTSDQGLISKTHKELIQLNNNKKI